ncbi:hypothetical protein D3C87_1749160 [compost metagenome]
MLRIPDDGIFEPALRIGRLAPFLAAPIGIAFFEGQNGGMGIREDTGIEAHHGERDLEGRGRRHASGAIALLQHMPAGFGVCDDGADGAGLSGRCGERGKAGQNA